MARRPRRRSSINARRNQTAASSKRPSSSLVPARTHQTGNSRGQYLLSGAESEASTSSQMARSFSTSSAAASGFLSASSRAASEIIHPLQSTRSPARRRWATDWAKSRFFFGPFGDGAAQRPERLADEPVVT